jgi:hypothetical protein
VVTGTGSLGMEFSRGAVDDRSTWLLAVLPVMRW